MKQGPKVGRNPGGEKERVMRGERKKGRRRGEKKQGKGRVRRLEMADRLHSVTNLFLQELRSEKY